jgi:hypothetical protein
VGTETTPYTQDRSFYRTAGPCQQLTVKVFGAAGIPTSIANIQRFHLAGADAKVNRFTEV